MGWFVKEALFRAASEVNIHLSPVLPHSMASATFKPLMDRNGLGKNNQLLLALGTYIEDSECVLLSIENKRVMHCGPNNRSRGIPFLHHQQLCTSLSAAFLASHPITTQTIPTQAMHQLTKAVENATGRLVREEENAEIFIQSLHEGFDLVAIIDYRTPEDLILRYLIPDTLTFHSCPVTRQAILGPYNLPGFEAPERHPSAADPR